MTGLKFNCPKCNQPLEAPPDLLGEVIDCPACSEAIKLPSPRHKAYRPRIVAVTSIIIFSIIFLVAGLVYYISTHQGFPVMFRTSSSIEPQHANSDTKNVPLKSNVKLGEVNDTLEDPVSGMWYLYRGKAVDTLSIKNIDGLLKGTLTKDPEWGGTSWPFHGMIVGDQVTLFYSTTETNESTQVKVDFSLKGTLQEQQISGNYTLKLMSTFISSGRTTTRSSDGLWIARRDKIKQ